jgi:hypothetical protein
MVLLEDLEDILVMLFLMTNQKKDIREYGKYAFTVESLKIIRNI